MGDWQDEDDDVEEVVDTNTAAEEQDDLSYMEMEANIGGL
jgi:hypothetical protein